MYRSILGISFLFYRSVYLHLCQYYTDMITLALLQILKSDKESDFSSIVLFKVVLALLGHLLFSEDV